MNLQSSCLSILCSWMTGLCHTACLEHALVVLCAGILGIDSALDFVAAWHGQASTSLKCLPVVPLACSPAAAHAPACLSGECHVLLPNTACTARVTLGHHVVCYPCLIPMLLTASIGGFSVRLPTLPTHKRVTTCLSCWSWLPRGVKCLVLAGLIHPVPLAPPLI